MQDQQQIVVGGDFNALLDQSEKSGGIIPPTKTLRDFNAFVDNNNLMDVFPFNGIYTWTNKRAGFANIAVRLDRFLISKDWQMSCSDISSDILAWPGSDHFPISLNLCCNRKCSDHCFHSSFKFESMWLRHPSFLQNIQHWWNEAQVEGSKMHQFSMKLKTLKSRIRVWNKTVFKNVFHEKVIVKEQLQEVYQKIIQEGMNEETFLSQKNLQDQWEELSSREEMYWRQKSRELWLQDGDRNTKFFHNSAKQKRTNNTIFHIKDASGNLLTNENLIRSEGLNFFKNLLAPEVFPSPSQAQVDEILESIPTVVTAQENEILMAPFTIQEIRKVVFSFPPDKAPGPDGFSALFYQSCWNIIGWDLWAAVEESRLSKSMLKYFNTTNISIIPKVRDPQTFADFRPISLCNLSYKIITKAIYLRIQHLIPRVISPEQGGFVPGRETMEGALVAHEVLHSINTNKTSNFVIKLDMMKAYDRVCWKFLLQILAKMGFSKNWCKWIKACISGAWFSVNIKRKPEGFFHSSQGIRQGDPLSPVLFIIMAEAFSRTISHQHLLNKWKGALIAGTNISITHSFFADDTLLFGLSNVQEARQILHTLNLYSTVSGQIVNVQKSKIYFFNTAQLVSDKFKQTLGFLEDFLPSVYLGIPFFMGSNKASYWSSVIQRIQCRIASWKVRWLSLAGRILLIKSVLAAIPNYFIVVLKIPSGVLDTIKKLIKGFLWSGNLDDSRKVPLISL